MPWDTSMSILNLNLNFLFINFIESEEIKIVSILSLQRFSIKIQYKKKGEIHVRTESSITVSLKTKVQLVIFVPSVNFPNKSIP